MKKLALLLLASGLLFVTGCEKASNPMSSNVNEESSTELNILAKRGGNGGGAASTTTTTTTNSGETAYACNADGEFVGYNETNNPDYGIYEYTLWAGKHNDAGTVTITNDDDYVYVTYNTNETADLSEVHVYVWESLDDIPTKRPAPGHADYVVENINADSYTVMIPLSDVTAPCGDTYYISTHAALNGNNTENDEPGTGDNAGETAYAGGDDAPGCFDDQKGAWWGYVNYTVECFYDVAGTVYRDETHDGGQDAGDNGISGISVILVDADGYVLGSTTTDADGNYLFEHVPAGSYTVQTTSVPEWDFHRHQNADAVAEVTVVDIDVDVPSHDFGFGPLFDLEASFDIAAGSDLDCYSHTVLTIDGVETSSLENRHPRVYEVVATAYDNDGNVLATETLSVNLTEDTSVNLTLGGWTCPAPPVDCNECADGELVVNGSFEGTLDGWTNNFGHSSQGYPIDHGTFWSSEGAWTVDLIGTGPSAPGFVEQTLCTEVGKEYTLTFDVLLNGNGTLAVTIDGNLQTVTSTGSKSITFTATSTSTVIRFEASAYLNYLDHNVLLDNVSIACGGGNDDDDDNDNDGFSFKETAYMFGNTSFCDDLGSNRWGWANYITTESVITETIYAGAGQCDTSKGTAVGTATIDGTTGTITITMTGDYYMNNLHLNIGDLPANLIANGNFNSNPSSFDPVTYTTTFDATGGVYVIIHMEAVAD